MFVVVVVAVVATVVLVVVVLLHLASNNNNNNKSSQRHVCRTPGASALLNSASSSCSSGKDRGNVPHSLLWGDTSRCGGGPHIDIIRNAGGAGRRGYKSRSERSHITPYLKSPTYIP